MISSILSLWSYAQPTVQDKIIRVIAVDMEVFWEKTTTKTVILVRERPPTNIILHLVYSEA